VELPCRTLKQGRRPDVSYLTPELVAQFSEIFKKYGEGEIRTPGTLTGSTVFKTAAFDRSATSPYRPEKMMH
jgi:hypothetical protein